jgi:hypothetical protein
MYNHALFSAPNPNLLVIATLDLSMMHSASSVFPIHLHCEFRCSFLHMINYRAALSFITLLEAKWSFQLKFRPSDNLHIKCATFSLGTWCKEFSWRIMVNLACTFYNVQPSDYFLYNPGWVCRVSRPNWTVYWSCKQFLTAHLPPVELAFWWFLCPF